MIKLFVADLDGCISEPFKTPDWESLTGIRELNQRSAEEESIPHLTICTGRPLPYAEAIAQLLNVRHPIIFESGGGLYNAETNQIRWAKAYDHEMRQRIESLKSWVRTEIIDRYENTIPEFAKQTDVGLINPDSSIVKTMYDEIRDHVLARYDEFEIHYTDVSVNVIMKDSNKGAGLEQLSDLTGIPLAQIAYIGDGTNDIPALKIAGRAFAPLNAREEVKELAEVIPEEVTDAVLYAYKQVMEENKMKSVEH